MPDLPPPPGANDNLPVATGRTDLPAMPDFLSQFADMFQLPAAAELSTGSQFPMIILSATRDGDVKVKRKKDVIARLPSNGSIIATVVNVAMPNAWFENAQADKPSCKSNDGVIGIGDIKDGNGVQTRKCAKCSKFQWGTAIGQDGQPRAGKACNQTISIAISCAGVAKVANDNGEYVVISDKDPVDHRWWYETYELPVGTTWYGKPADANGYTHPGPVILRLTTSSFPEWEKALADIKKIHPSGNWPIEACLWHISWTTANKGGNNVGIFQFKVAPIAAQEQAWLLTEAKNLRDHDSIKVLGEAGHEAEGVIRHV